MLSAIPFFVKNMLPNSQNPIATGFHVGVLRCVKFNPLHLPCIQYREFFSIPMPVIAVKLDNQLTRRHESINAKLFAHHMLPEIRYADFIKNFVSYFFNRRCFHGLLNRIHSCKLFGSIGVFVPTSQRTVLDIIVQHS